MFLNSVYLRDVLSFRDTKVELQKLNVLIGPNGSGKSNFVDGLSLLAGFKADSAAFCRTQGGAAAWISKRTGASAAAKLKFGFENYGEYEVVFGAFGPALHIYAETLRGNNSKIPTLTRHESEISGRGALAAQLKPEKPAHDSSILSYRFSANTDWRRWQEQLAGIRTYRLSGLNEIRQGVPIGSASADPYLSQTGENLAKIINDFYLGDRLNGIDEALRRFGENYTSVKAEVSGTYWGLRLTENHLDSAVTASRISDGTLRFLQLLAILRHPEPPPLIMIEEPELGLHPDAISIVADELMEASERTQIVVTTHSPELLKSLQQVPDCVLVCEKDFDNATSIQRLSPKRARLWLKEFSSLGELWRSGAIGGNRW